MRVCFRAVALALAGVILGCGSSVSPVDVTVVIGPHHGTMVRLPEDHGFVELVNEPEVNDRRSPQPTSIVAYFLQADGKSPLSPAPSDVNVSLSAGRDKGARRDTSGAGQSIPLSPEPKADDPAGSSRFVSKPGSYDLATIRGTLSAKTSSQEISTPFGGGR
jgi:hypothetical protein